MKIMPVWVMEYLGIMFPLGRFAAIFVVNFMRNTGLADGIHSELVAR
jgi:hypothetical protein